MTGPSSGDVWDDQEGEGVLRRLEWRECFSVFLRSSSDGDAECVRFLVVVISGSGCAIDWVRRGEAERLV